MLKYFLNLNLAVKMMSGFAATAIITLAVGWFGGRDISLDNTAIETLYKRHVEGISDLKQAQIELLNALSGQKNALVAYTPEQRDANLAAMRSAETRFGTLMNRLSQGASSPEERTEPILEPWGQFQSSNSAIAARIANSEAEQAFQLSNGPARDSFEKTQQALERAANYRKEQSRLEYEASLERNRAAQVYLMGLALLGSIMGLAFGYFISRLVARPVREIVAGFERLEHGDLTHSIGLDTDDEIGALATAYNRVIERLRGVVGEVQSASTRVRDAVASVSARAGSAHAHHSGATIEATAAAIKQIAGVAEQNAALAAKAASEFSSAQSSSAEGREAVRRMTEAVLQINDSSKRISQIIHVMDEIAFQTNLLALNAAVEAAHAGDEGKGFAVVAAEVRALAQRSADAAKDITELIEDSVNRAATGQDLALQSGRALEEIGRNVECVNEMVRSMAQSSNEQRQAMHEANLAIGRIDEAMQQNAEEVEHLTGTVSYFRIG